MTIVTGTHEHVLYPDAEVDAGSIPFFKNLCCEGRHSLERVRQAHQLLPFLRPEKGSGWLGIAIRSEKNWVFGEFTRVGSCGGQSKPGVTGG